MQLHHTLLLSLLSLTTTTTTTTIAHPLTPRAFSPGPVIATNFADPTFIKVGPTYYAFSTASAGINIPIATSPDFATWTVTPNADALPVLPVWSSGATWAPSVVQVGPTFVMYFTAASKANPGKHCIGVAVAPSVTGPYNSTSPEPFTCQIPQGGAIDPSGFQDTDGSLYVAYKIDGNSLGGGGPCGNSDGAHPTPLMLQKLAADGTTSDGSAPVQLLDRGPADGPLIEAPQLVRMGATYVLFFSSNCYNGPSYDTSYATSPHLLGPYTKAKRPLLTSGGGPGGKLLSPGGAMVDPAGRQMVFHADAVASDAGTRQMWTAGVGFEGGEGVVVIT